MRRRLPLRGTWAPCLRATVAGGLLVVAITGDAHAAERVATAVERSGEARTLALAAAAVTRQLDDALAEVEARHRELVARVSVIAADLRAASPESDDRRRLVAAGLVGMLARQRSEAGDARAAARARVVVAGLAEPLVGDERRMAALRLAQDRARTDLARLGDARGALERGLDAAHQRSAGRRAMALDAGIEAEEEFRRRAARAAAMARASLLAIRVDEAGALALVAAPQPLLPPSVSAPGGNVVLDTVRRGLASAAPGSLRSPIDGEVSERFGDSRQVARRRGVTLVSARAQPVLAPSPGKVAFAGPFRSFGLVLIIDHGHEYHTLVAGLSELWVREGDEVGGGEPIGRVSPGVDGLASLYLELRRGGEPVDPIPAMAGHEDKVRS